MEPIGAKYPSRERWIDVSHSSDSSPAFLQLLVPHPGARGEERLAEAPVLVGDGLLEPGPSVRARPREERREPPRELASRRLDFAVPLEGVQVLVDPEKREGPRARAGERAWLQGSAAWKRPSTRLRRLGLAACPTTVPSAHSARPWLSSEPALSSHFRSYDMKLRKRPLDGVEGVVHEGEVTRPQRAQRRRVLAPRVFEQCHEPQPARVVVEAVAVLVTGDVERGVLQEPGVVGHRPKVDEARLGELCGAYGERPRLERAPLHPGTLCKRARAKLVR